jgi:hypothetical protein
MRSNNFGRETYGHIDYIAVHSVCASCADVSLSLSFFCWRIRPSYLFSSHLIWKLWILRAIARTSGTRDQSISRPLPTQDNTNTVKNADIHSWLEWDSSPRSQCSSGRRHFVPQTARPLGSILCLFCVRLFFLIALFPLNVLIFRYDRICVVYLSYVSPPPPPFYLYPGISFSVRIRSVFIFEKIKDRM